MASKNETIPAMYINILSSMTSSVASKTLVAPIERVKLMYQSEGELIRTGKLEKSWRGYSDLIRKTLKNEGGFSFWRGNYTYIIRYTINSSIGIVIKDELHRIDPCKSCSKVQKNFAYGGIGGLIGMFVAYPIEKNSKKLLDF